MKVTDIKSFSVADEDGRGYFIVKVETDAGIHGLGEVGFEVIDPVDDSCSVHAQNDAVVRPRIFEPVEDLGFEAFIGLSRNGARGFRADGKYRQRLDTAFFARRDETTDVGGGTT